MIKLLRKKIELNKILIVRSVHDIYFSYNFIKINIFYFICFI